jgi:hypothetical protein
MPLHEGAGIAGMRSATVATRTIREGKMRDKHRDNDDARNPLEGNAKTGGSADTKSEARGDAREAVGNTARDTDTNERGPEGNDRTKKRDDREDHYDRTLHRS